MSTTSTTLTATFAAGQREMREFDRRALADVLDMPPETTWEDALTEVERLRAELADNAAAFENEHGMGKPPVAGWHYEGDSWYRGRPNVAGTARVSRYVYGGKFLGWEWGIFNRSFGSRTRTARAAMRDATRFLAAEAAKKGGGL